MPAPNVESKPAANGDENRPGAWHAQVKRGRATLTSRAVLIVFGVAFVLRAGWGIYHMKTAGMATLELPDEEQYWLMATSLHNGEGLRDELGFRAGRMPLYPGLLSIVAGSPTGIAIAKIAQWFVGALGAVFATVLGTRISGRTVGVFAGLMVAVDPFLIFFSSLILTETVFVTLLVALWGYAAGLVWDGRSPTIRQGLVLGMLCVACVYARESTLGLIGVASLIHLAWRRFDRSAGLGTMIVGCVLVAGLFPWALRNRAVLGEWCWLTTRAGISLYDGVGPQATGAADLGDIKNSAAVKGLTEVQYNRHFLKASFDAMRDGPVRIVKLAWRKLVRMWNPVPNAADYQSSAIRLISAAWMVPMLLLSLSGVFVLFRIAPTRAGAVVVYLLLPALYLSALHMIFVGSVRYRLGAMPMLAVLAAVTLERLWAVARDRNKKPHAEAQSLQSQPRIEN